jgi:hypothetical protein
MASTRNLILVSNERRSVDSRLLPCRHFTRRLWMNCPNRLLRFSKIEAQRELSRTIAAGALGQRRLQDSKRIGVADVCRR